MLGASLFTGGLVRKIPCEPRMVEETGVSAWRPHLPRTIAEVRKYDLRLRHIGDDMRASLKRATQQGWQMFQQEGSVDDGVWQRRWCVYPSDTNDPLYEEGLWFDDEATATACLKWKRARRRPWAITRAIVRAWRALPWR